jgi:hypothetical protein
MPSIPPEPLSFRLLLLVPVLALAAGCETPLPPAPDAAHDHPVATPRPAHTPVVADRDVARDLARVRAATAPFHRLEEAVAAGWDTDLTGCMDHPELGGMGHHFANLTLLDGQVELERPEALLYVPHGDGWRLLGVEYIVPFDAWDDPDPPTLFGQPFVRNEGFGIWALHAWIWLDNPTGIFQDWNPRVSCP